MKNSSEAAAASARYLRHEAIHWFDRDYVRGLDIVVVGAGAVGNELVKNLCLLGVGKLHVIDFDRIEVHNLPRTILFRESDIGRSKAEVVAERSAKFDPNVELSFSDGDFWDTLSFARLRRTNAVVSCVDNLEARLRLNVLCQLAGVPLVNTAIDSRSVAVEHYPFAKAPDCACYGCTLPPTAYARMRDRYSCGWLRKVAFEERKIPTTIITSAFAGAFAAAEVLQRLGSPAGQARRVFLDTRSLAMSEVALAPDPECVACAARPARAVFVNARRAARLPLDPAVVPAVPEEVVFGEPIVLEATCQSCGATVVVNEPARKHNDSLAFCPDCRLQSRLVSIAERLPLPEFLDRFGTAAVPGKFLRVDLEDHAVIIELE
jgi:molybdopterin/thiamine biosynthesis adenylyltransferase